MLQGCNRVLKEVCCAFEASLYLYAYSQDTCISLDASLPIDNCLWHSIHKKLMTKKLI
jgi:hypothetical protein